MRWILIGGVLAGVMTCCAPKPPAAAPSSTPSSTAAPSPAGLLPSGAPIRAVSRGTQRQPAQYIVRNKASRIVYEIRSGTVVYDRATDGSAVATFSTPHVIFHAGSGRTVAADSPKAVANDKDKNVTMTGGVHAKTDDGKTLSCATLTYDARDKQILCQGDVVLTNTKTNQTASGDRLVTDPAFDHVILSGSR
ncbi:MAG: LPS export ABC transporter periplasmic protein LptC [Vulcanimicrobiaceae bacterium]